MTFVQKPRIFYHKITRLYRSQKGVILDQECLRPENELLLIDKRGLTLSN